MMKYFFTLFLVILFGFNLPAQDIYLKGVVQDSTAKPLTSASLVVANAKTQKFQGYAITDDKGLFTIKLVPNQDFVVKVTYMGYKPVIDTIRAKEVDVFKKYILKPDVAQLEGVEISYDMPVKIKGDTIVYNADSFTNGNEKKLGDVLKKMPGIDVEKDGTVKVEGKKVKKVMVEGKDFFEGDSKLASKNIPANAVKKVEVLRNYNENSQVRNFEDNEDSYALNIKLKKGKDRFWFGDITAGGGITDKYLLHPKLFYYSPKNTYNFIGDFNNIGSPSLTWSEMFKMTGGFGDLMRKGGSSFNFSDDGLGFSTMQDDKAKEKKAKFAAFNYHIPLGKNLNLKGFLIGNMSETNYYTESQKIYSASSIVDQEDNNSLQKNLTGIAKITLDYNPNVNLSFRYKAMYKNLKINEDNITYSTINGRNQDINDARKTDFSQHFEVYKTLKNDNLFAFEIQHQYNKNIPVLELISPNEFFSHSALIQLTPQQEFDLLQNQQTNSNKITGLADYYHIINSVSHLNISLGNEWVYQQYHSNMQQKMDNGSLQNLSNPLLKNQADYQFYDQYIGLHYKLLWKKFLIRPAVNLHYYVLNDRQFNDTKTIKKWSLLPEMKIKYSLKRGSHIRFSYQLTNDFSDVYQYAQSYVLSSYNRLKAGNRNLENVYRHQFRLGYSSYSMTKFSFIFASISYSKKLNSIKNSSTLYQTDIVSLPVNINHPEENVNLNLSYSKRYVYWNYRLSSIGLWNQFYSIINNNEVKSTSYLQNYNLTVSSNLDGFFNFDLGYSLNINDFQSTINQSKYITHKPSIGLELSFFKKSLLIKPKYDYYDYSNKNGSVKRKYAFMSAEVFYSKPGSNWEFILSGDNILSTHTLDKENLTDLYLATSKYYIQAPIWMFSVKYKL